jgi:hypothetical protein
MKDFWEKRYAEEDFAYGTEPNVFFASELDKFSSAGNLLLPMEGEGRNAAHALSKGWRVTAFDYSKEGQAKAVKLAADSGFDLDYRVSSAELFDFGQERFDVVAFIFAHLPSALRTAVHKSAQNSLKPGGRVIVEAFHPNQVGRTSGGPKDPSMLYTSEMLRDDFSGLHPIFEWEGEVSLNEGPFHQGDAYVSRFVAEKRK